MRLLIKQVMQVAVRALVAPFAGAEIETHERSRFEPTCMIVNSIHLRGLYD